MHYNYFRDYDPAIGRYQTSDPKGLWAGLSTFAYADSSPLSLIDPYGLTARPGNGAISFCGEVRDYPHNWLCVGSSCFGYMPGNGKGFFGGPGWVQPDRYDPKKCSPYKPLCDGDGFSKCVRDEIKDTQSDSGTYFLLGKNCRTWAIWIIRKCEIKACLGS